MVEKKVQKIKAQSDYLSGSKSSEDEVNQHLRTSQEERVYGTIKGSAQATQAALSHTTTQWDMFGKIKSQIYTDIER